MREEGKREFLATELIADLLEIGVTVHYVQREASMQTLTEFNFTGLVCLSTKKL